MPNPNGILGREVEGLSLGDARLDRRAQAIFEQLGEDPTASFPALFEDSSELEAVYRFLRNDRVDIATLLDPHLRASTERCRASAVVRVAHDTTDFLFNDEYPRDGLGPIKAKGYGQGFFLHAAVAVDCGTNRDVLGLLGALTYVRAAEGRKEETVSEGARWQTLVQRVREQVGADVQLVHVMDREADVYSLLSHLVAEGERFVIRHSGYRVLPKGSTERTTLELLARAPVLVQREVDLTRRSQKRSGKQRRIHPPRADRVATVAASAIEVTLARPASAPTDCPETLTLNIVRAYEPEPPEGEAPVDWALLTTEPIDTAEQLLAVIDHYRARWRIEEFFKSIKSGCAFEKRQLTSYKTLLVALGLTLPIAFTLLRLRNLGRSDDSSPATTVLSSTEITVLRALKPKVPEAPTVRQAMLGVASLGGHIKQNGDPGWMVLGRGYEKLLHHVAGYTLAKRLSSAGQM
jgi:hypothetical protein